MKRHVIPLIAITVVVILISLIPGPELVRVDGFSRAVYDDQGQLLRLTLSPDEKYRLWVPLDKIEPSLVEATLLYEDRYFYRHVGFNPVALFRAAWETYVSRQRRVGASTISMQLARLRFNIKSHTVLGKLEQILRAMQLEWFYSKDEILEAYLNLAPYGGNIEGVGAASLVYFNKRASKLTLHEAITLAVVPQNPQQRFPVKNITPHSPLQQARLRLLQDWLDGHPGDKGNRERLELLPDVRSLSALPFKAPHYVDALLQQWPQQTQLDGTLNQKLQAIVERQASSYVESRKQYGLYNTSALLVDYRDMSVKALLGSADFFNNVIQGQVNGVLAKRSPGSTLKPFIYALGIEQGFIHPQSILKDAPTSFGNYNPENFDEEFSGPISVTDALVKSRNIPAIQVASWIKQPDLYQFLKLANVKLPHSREYYGMALVLGGAEVTMEELVSLYAILANQGKYQSLRWHQQQAGESRQVLGEAASFMALDMLKANPPPRQPYQSDWLRSPLAVYWKTGTSYAYRDAWSVGVFGPYVLAVWVGNFDGHGNPLFVGREAAAPLFFSIIDAVRSESQGLENVRHIAPALVQAVEVCAISGQQPTQFCRHKIHSWFIPGVSPIDKCQVHRPVYVDMETGLRACSPHDKHISEKVFEFWSSDLLKIFRQAGVPRLTPPPYHPRCRISDMAQHGKPPMITSPRTRQSYQFRAGKEQEKIPFVAVTDSDVQTLFWFLDKTFIGRSKPDKPLFWRPLPGSYLVRVIDDQGRGDARKLVVSQ